MFQPNFKYTNKIVRLLARVQAAREVIINSPLIPAWEKQLQRDALIKQTHHTTSIEGNPLTLEEVGLIIEGKEILAHEKDKKEVRNYVDVLNYIDSLPENGPITEEILLEIHRLTAKNILPDDSAGNYRKVQVIVGDPKTGKVTYTPPGPAKVPSLTKYLIEWLNTEDALDLMPAVQAGIAHHELARIHPFVDGNGRTARALATLVLTKRGFDTKRFFALEEHYNKERPSYYSALSSADVGDRDLTEWLEYFLFGIAVEISRVENTVLKLSSDRSMKEKFGQIGLSSRQIKAIEYLKEKGQITNKEYQEICEVSASTAKRDLQDLVDKKVLKQIGEKGQSIHYVLNF
ncbi:filamentation induced by cAMP protein Fic [Methanosarcina sp. MTP4]|uniref:Fic family protein n=1 Tax=Methanosarcina sp. MTP4 TaxID=1434100 RepID=UPI00061611F2|nr:Fic family protein [Methanosarcina sp. MTP4]AKB24281.1 filamentation induced by cAMP protein Fic [Methanosarcina sp. MTP4]